MSAPVVHIIAGPNGAGKSTFYQRVIGPVTGLPFINADLIAREYWPDAAEANAYEAAAMAAAARTAAFEAGRSFATETVFSHPSKVELVRQASGAGYLVSLHVIAVPEDLAVARVAMRVEHGGHDVPEDKIRQRYARLWGLVVEACASADETSVYANVQARRGSAFRPLMSLRFGRLISAAELPPWLAPELKHLAARR